MSRDDPRAVAVPSVEERAPVQGAIESVGTREALGLADAPDERAEVHLVARLGGPSVITGEQWRVLARVGAGRRVDELAQLLALSTGESLRIVADLVHAGLVDVVRPPVPLTAPPTGPALPAPTAVSEADDEADGDERVASDDDDDVAAAAPPAEPEVDWKLEATLEGQAWTPERPSVEDSWVEPEPIHVPVEPKWDVEPIVLAAASWDDHGKLIAPHAEWDPVPDVPAMAPGTLAPRPLPPDAKTDEPGAIADLLGEPAPDATDDELVNRALLFKFLSSVRE